MTKLWVPPHAERYVEADLLTAARELDCRDVVSRTIRTFVEYGLLDHPQRAWPGHGGGSSPGWWPRAQYDLWLTLLRQRKQLIESNGAHKAQITPALCNIVVSAWVYFGDAAGIPLRQVRRAMRTWASANQHVNSLVAARRAAQDIIRTAGHDKAPNRRALKEQLAQIVWIGRVPDREDLLYRMRLLVDPFGKGVTKGPEGASFSPEILTALITERIEMLQVLQRGEPHLPDGMWEWARFTLLWSRGFYLQAQPQILNDPSLQKHPEMARLYQSETFETMMNSVCFDLLTVLAVAEQAQQATHLPPEFQPHVWLEGKLKAHIKAWQAVSTVLRLDEARQSYLEVSVRLKSL